MYVIYFHLAARFLDQPHFSSEDLVTYAQDLGLFGKDLYSKIQMSENSKFNLELNVIFLLRGRVSKLGSKSEDFCC